jgi:hypothetical protein
MPSCCQGATCACKIASAADGHMSVTGSGSAGDPFLLSADVAFAVNDTAQFDLTLTGTGDSADPWVLSTAYAATAKLTNIPDVNAPAPTNGQVLGFNTASNQWTAQAPTTAPTGAVSHGPALTGDGSAGSPLTIVPDASRLVQTSASGVGLSDAGMGAVVRHFADATARAAMTPAAVLNSLSILASNPGHVDYYDGSAWKPLLTQVTFIPPSPVFLQISGPYSGTPITIKMVPVNATADSSGVFTVLGATDLTGFAGVLSLSFQETGTAAQVAVLGTSGSTVIGTVFNLIGGAPAVGANVTGYVTAYLY